MIYSSIPFLFYFLPLFLAVYALMPGTRAKNILLFLASLLFYAWGAGKMVVLLLGVGCTTWLFSLLIAKTRHRLLFLVLSVIFHIGILFYFKYLGFVIDNLIYAGADGLPELTTWMPLGVSFFIFQSIAYNIDVYRKGDRFEKNPANVILFITMFPQLISGPLVRYHLLGPQLKHRTFDFGQFTSGIKRFIIGLAKKVLIANPLGMLVDKIMAPDGDPLGPGIAWIGIVAFTLQLFFDFAGYTDMAIGIGKMIGIELPENFNYPYISRSISEFWRRWHMSLSAWLRDYLFMPMSLTMRRWRNAGAFLALLITFLICGLWHGPGWTFLIWGLIQGLFLGLEQVFLGKYLQRLKAGAILYTLFVVMIGLVFFRSPDLEYASHYLTAMFSPAAPGALPVGVVLSRHHWLLLGLGAFFSIPFPYFHKIKSSRLRNAISWISTLLLVALLLLSMMALTTETYNPFLYFRF